MRQFLLAILTGLALLQGACSSSPKVPEEATPPAAQTPEAGGPGQTTIPIPKDPHADGEAGPAITLKKVDGSDIPEKTIATPSKATHGIFVGVEPDVSLRYLRNGNIRYRKSYLRKDGQSAKDIARVSKGQKPHAIVVSCSDSRVPPEIVFDQKLGEIFVVRTAGQALSPEVVASIEYAVANLGSRLILVLGHSACGAVHATADAISGKADESHKGPLDASENIAALVKNLRPRIEETVRSQPSKNLVNEGWANVRGAARELFQMSPYLQEALRTGQVRVVGALYELETGAVDFK